jgi:hypothetical protein
MQQPPKQLCAAFAMSPLVTLPVCLPRLQDLSPGDVLVSVPISCTIHYRDADIAAAAAATSSDGSRDASSSSSDGSSSSSDSRRASLRQLQGGVPAASDGSHGAWQFKMALEVCGGQVLTAALNPPGTLNLCRFSV